jgi:ribosome-associated protein
LKKQINFAKKFRTIAIMAQKPTNALQTEQLCQLIIYGLQEKKGIDIVMLDLRSAKNAITDFFIICSGNTDNHVDALSESVSDEVLKHSGEKAWHTEGKQHKEWILMDYIHVIVHIFRKDRRKFYALEDLWGDAEPQTFEEAISLSFLPQEIEN